MCLKPCHYDWWSLQCSWSAPPPHTARDRSATLHATRAARDAASIGVLESLLFMDGQLLAAAPCSEGDAGRTEPCINACAAAGSHSKPGSPASKESCTWQDCWAKPPQFYKPPAVLRSKDVNAVGQPYLRDPCRCASAAPRSQPSP
jgi:hypothetical protein